MAMRSCLAEWPDKRYGGPIPPINAITVKERFMEASAVLPLAAGAGALHQAKRKAMAREASERMSALGVCTEADWET